MPERKQEYVTAIFDTIAPRYDEFTRAFSFGMDAKWKRSLLNHLATRRDAIPPGDIVDLATGTGDFARELAQMFPDRAVVGIDASTRMIEEAVKRGTPRNVSFALGDMMHLAAAHGTIAIATAGYAFRNTPDFRVALNEIAVRLKPGGLLVVLDFYKPRSRVWRSVYVNYLRVAGKFVGWKWHRRSEVYGYIADSIDAYVTCFEFEAEASRVGLELDQRLVWLGGGVVGSGFRKI